jgi:hypothetical protein
LFCCAFLWAKEPNAKDMHKEIFPVYGGKCLSCKAIHNGVANVSLMTKKLKNGGVEVAETTVKRHKCCEFRRTGEVMGQVYQYWRIRRDLWSVY